MNFIIRPKSIILGFLKGFFQQKKLYTHIPNEFQFIDNVKQGSLIIKTSEHHDEETVNAVPAIILQEGGFTENKEVVDHLNTWDLLQGTETHIGSFYHPIVLHCVAKEKGSCEALQAAVAKAIIMFRKAIYELGVDNISPLQGSPPQRLTQPEQAINTIYDSTVSFQCKMSSRWYLDNVGGDLEQFVSFMITAALKDLEFDENCVPLDPIEDWFQQNISLDQNP